MLKLSILLSVLMAHTVTHGMEGTHPLLQKFCEKNPLNESCLLLKKWLYCAYPKNGPCSNLPNWKKHHGGWIEVKFPFTSAIRKIAHETSWNEKTTNAVYAQTLEELVHREDLACSTHFIEKTCAKPGKSKRVEDACHHLRGCFRHAKGFSTNVDQDTACIKASFNVLKEALGWNQRHSTNLYQDMLHAISKIRENR